MTDHAYLFAYFTHNGQYGMRIAASRDGLLWQDVPGAEYLISPDSGLMRDPFLILGPDAQFHLIWTTNWESRDIGYATSSDLVNWSEQARLPVMESVAGTRNCWAPEMTYDPVQENFLIYWASTVPGFFPETAGSSESDYNHRMWATTTRDFKSLSDPQVFFDPGFNVIDVTLLQAKDGSIRLIAKDERLIPEKKNLFVCEAKTLQSPFGSPSEAFTKSWVEGPATLQIGDWTYVYYDVYREKRYEAKRTKDFKNWEDVSDKVRFPQGARHGSVITLSARQYEQVLSAVALKPSIGISKR